MPRILLLEDNEDIQRDLAELLELEGYEVVTASNGVKGLEVLTRRPLPDLIILDLMMPVMDGWTFRSELLAAPDLAGIPVILTSGASGVREEAAALKASGYLIKPFSFDVLRSAVHKHCGPPG